jgi:hypothetical protein
MAENKTRPTGASVESYLDAIEDEARRKDCNFLIRLGDVDAGVLEQLVTDSVAEIEHRHGSVRVLE